jgi:hypothetical protein
LYGWRGLQSRSFALARDSSPIFLRGTMNDWDIGDKMNSIGDNHFAVTLRIPAGQQSFKLASEDWSTFILGASGSARLIKANSLDTEGPDIKIEFPTAGLYRFSLHAPDSGAATLSVTPVSD